MKFADLILIRQSDRKYDSKPVGRSLITQCIEAARLAPSANNSQPWFFVVVDDPELKTKVAATTSDPIINFNKFTLQAPVIVVMLSTKPDFVTRIASGIKKRDWSQIDAGIAAAHFCLQAAELGLGTCMIGWFDEKQVKALLNIPESESVALLFTLGYPPEGYPNRNKSRKPMDQTMRFNGF